MTAIGRRSVLVASLIVPTAHIPLALAVDALPDQRRIQLRASRRVRAGQDAGELPRRAEVVDALDAVHVAGGDRMDGGQVRRASGGRVAGADRFEHGVGTAQAGRGGDGDDGVVADQLGRFAGRQNGDGAHEGMTFRVGVTWDGGSRRSRAAEA